MRYTSFDDQEIHFHRPRPAFEVLDLIVIIQTGPTAYDDRDICPIAKTGISMEVNRAWCIRKSRSIKAEIISYIIISIFF